MCANSHSIAASGSLVAVGTEDSKVTVYKWDGKTLSEAGVLTNNKGAVSALAFSPDGSKLAAGDVCPDSILKVSPSHLELHSSQAVALFSTTQQHSL